MPNNIIRTVGIEFSKVEMQYLMDRKLDFSNDEDLNDIMEFLEKSHETELMAKEYGIDDFFYISDIEICDNCVSVFY